MKCFLIFFLVLIIVISCSKISSIQSLPRSEKQYYVSCPPHLFYCYRKSQIICHRGYRVLNVSTLGEKPEMIIECE